MDKSARGCMKNEEGRVKVEQGGLLVPPGKSKRLATLRSKALTEKSPEFNSTRAPEAPPAMSRRTTDALAEARVSILRQIERIQARYPAGKRNKLFAIRYGEFERLKQKSIKELFALLAITDASRDFNLIADLNFDGQALPVSARQPEEA